MGLRGLAARMTSGAPGFLGAPVRVAWRGTLRTIHRLRSTSLAPDEILAPALVFAPHPDDETLGCGGTIALKRQGGADVSVAFLTDGSASGAGVASAARRQEALAACGVLGVAPDRVHFLDFPDGRLSAEESRAVPVVAALLDRLKPAQVFIPFGVGEHPDHAATGRIVLSAQKGPATTFEYPVWYRRHWPWVPMEFDLFDPSINARFGTRFCGAFRRRVDVSSVLDRKRAALNEHRSQLSHDNRDTDHPSLTEVSRGAFLKCFFDGAEWFREVGQRG